jgi:pteridine reductase
MGPKMSSMRLQKIQRIQAVAKTGTVKKNPAMKRDFSQFSRRDILSITTHASAGVKKRGRALVTGGAVRIGRAIALALADAGLDVAIHYHRSAAAARRTARDVERRGVRAVTVRADLRRPEAAARVVTEAARALHGLDVLVNNAGVFSRTPFGRTPRANWDTMVAVNLRAPFFCAQAAARVMRGGGHIINIADVAVGRTWTGYIPYTVAKSGLVTLTRLLAAVLRTRGIAVNCVAPGMILRPHGFPRARWQALTRGRTRTAEDVAAAVTAFATGSRDITGRIAVVDGAVSRARGGRRP